MRMVASFAARQRHDGACLLLCRRFGRVNVAIETPARGTDYELYGYCLLNNHFHLLFGPL
jgi:hypothetical protein